MKTTLKCTPDNTHLVPKVRLLNCVSKNNDSLVEEWSIKKKTLATCFCNHFEKDSCIVHQMGRIG